MNCIEIKAYAKINLFLEVCEKRPDSYHNIDSIMHTVSLHDTVKVRKSDVLNLSNNAGLPNDEHNLAYKAAKCFFDYTKINAGADIHIEKNIPMSAGLAGGSADAAAVLRGLNVLYETDIDIDTLCEIGCKLGADVPFCIRGGSYLTRGIGDVCTKCASLPPCYIVISKKGDGVSTPFAYGEIDASRCGNDNIYKSSNGIVNSLEDGNLFEISKKMYNAFEAVVAPLRACVNEQKDILNQCNAVRSMMSGSGPSVFGLFVSYSDAEKAFHKLTEYGADAHLCQPK